MNTTIFVGFRHQGMIKGCTWQRTLKQDTVGNRVLDILGAVDVDYAKEIFECIEWNPRGESHREKDGTYLVKLLELGIEEYEETLRRTLKFLYRNIKGSDIKRDLARYLRKRNGKTMARLVASSLDFQQNRFSTAFIFDLDANQVEVIENRRISVS
ncbi:hypothetical protein [Alicyclobacillus sp. ALC3]|uniref:hypothetical protein n=1 Tax=Alicyclobacillus sp. ALC3 TaxID=2796143 RepID=UPI002379FEF6|nr:hypothetical protein [Alicyclobacillus sp. ALC3]WDL98870.1 hypothetical protein JC200_09550 [Alicyclobacillus sp. ALC3]